MEIINLPRQYGKTKMLIELSAKRKVPILLGTYISKEEIIKRAEEMNLKIPEPIIYRDNMIINSDNILIDDLEFLIQRILGVTVDVATITEHVTPIRSTNILENTEFKNCSYGDK